MKRLGSSRQQTVTNTLGAQLDPNVIKGPSTKPESVGSKLNLTKPDPLKDLTTKVEELTRLVETMQKQDQQHLTSSERQYSLNRTQSKRGQPYSCPSCVEQSRQVGRTPCSRLSKTANETGKLQSAAGEGNLVTKPGIKSQPASEVKNDKTCPSSPSTPEITSTQSHRNQVVQPPPQPPCVAKGRAGASLIGKKA